MVGLLLLAAGPERTQAQGPAQTSVSVKVAFIGDAGTGSNARKVLELIRNERVDLVLHQGDFAYDNESPAAARDWNDQVNAILGADFPYFGAVGNHDNSAWSEYQKLFQDRLNLNPDVVCQNGNGGYGVNTSCQYKGITFILSGLGTRGSGHVQFIEERLAGDDSTWSICTWHKNQRDMQIGGKRDEVGWDAYEACREGGAIIATGHEHSYSRTKTLSNMRRQTVDAEWPDRNNLRVTPGSTFAFVSGLGGKSVRDQSRCSASSYPYGCNGEWASIYSSDQGAKPGALFVEFNVGDDPNKAIGQFINVDGRVIDEFVITADGDNTAPVGDDQQVTTTEDAARSITLTGSDADGDDLSFSVLNGPNSGSLGGILPDLTYTPDADFNGSDSFIFFANDGKTNSAPASVSIIVTPLNDAPVADNQSVVVAEGQSRDIILTGSDPDGDPLAFTVLTDPANGTSNGSLSGTPPNVTYTPEDGFIGDDSFTFSVNDGQFDSNVATVSLNVTVNTPPVAQAQSVTTEPGVPVAITLTGNDANGEPLTFSVDQGPTNGNLSGNPPDLNYTPQAGFTGADSFTFTVTDGTATSPPAKVGITVSPQIVGQGLKLSRNSDFSTTDSVFNYGDTVYILAWSDRVDFNNIKKSEWKLEHKKGSLTNNRDMTHTGQVVIDKNVKNLKKGKSSRVKFEIKIEDRSGRKFGANQKVTLNGPGS